MAQGPRPLSEPPWTLPVISLFSESLFVTGHFSMRHLILLSFAQ